MAVQGMLASELAYAEEIWQHKREILPALLQLQHHQVCARCCLRFAGIRSGLYSCHAPSSAALVEAVAARAKITESDALDATASTCPGNRTQVAALAKAFEPGSPASGTAAERENGLELEARWAEPNLHTERLEGQDCEADHKSKPSGLLSNAKAPCVGNGGAAVGETAGGPSVAADSAVCSVCLGVLQSLDGPFRARPLESLGALPATASCGALWEPLLSGDISSIAEHIKSQGYYYDSFSVELSVPASAQLRQLAMWHHLRACEATAHLFCGETFRDDAVDLKETLRLRELIVDPLAKALGKPHDPDASTFKITLSYIHPATAGETDFLFGKPQPPRSSSRKRKRAPQVVVGRNASENTATLASKLSAEDFRRQCCVPPSAVDHGAQLLVSCRKLPQYVGGCYRKLERDVSQTPWVIDGARKGRTSVQEEIEKVVLPALRCDGAKFITAEVKEAALLEPSIGERLSRNSTMLAGQCREDLDVRMLGGGRPFVLEINNQRAPMPSADVFQEMQERLRQSDVGVEVRGLQPVGKEKLQLIKEGEQHKQKSYEALCELPCEVTDAMVERINGSNDLLIAQTTPTRVAHRRALLVRDRLVYSMSCEKIADRPCALLLRLRTQAGTYIKEFVHGDEGRTVPHLGAFLGLKQPARILSLDVLEVHMGFLSQSTG